ncbi:hypothetical protein CHU98_g8251 [Xylaria longipes]|nr:hypothetical protein CHU98_g8251 [Xylaria longipes]
MIAEDSHEKTVFRFVDEQHFIVPVWLIRAVSFYLAIMTNFLLFTLLVQAASVLAVPQAGHAKLTRRQSIDCTYSVVAGSGATCDSVAGAWGISEALVCEALVFPTVTL